MTQKSKILLVNNFVQADAIVRSVKATKSDLATVFSNMVYFGWTPSKALIETLSTYSSKDLEKFWTAIEPTFKEVTGSDRKMENFVVYKNFPAEVLEKSEAEYWLCQILMYVGFSPEAFAEDVKERPALEDKKDLKVLQLSNDETLNIIYTNLVVSKNRWNDQQKETAVFLNKSFKEEMLKLSDFGFKENGINLIKECIVDGRAFEIKDATDILRLAASLSDGDVSLRTNVKFKKFKRSERKLLLSLLDQSKNLESDVSMRQSVWKKFMFQLHPGDYNFTNVQKVYGELCKGELKSFNSTIEKNIHERNENVLTMLSNRQGDLLRRFHKLYEVFGEKAVEKVIAVIGGFDTLQLLKLKKYVQTINTRNTLIYAPNGNWTKAKIVQKNVKSDIQNQTVYVEETPTIETKIDVTVQEEIVEVVDKTETIVISDTVFQDLVNKFSGKLDAEKMKESFKKQVVVAAKPTAPIQVKEVLDIPTEKVELSTVDIKTIVDAVTTEIAKRMESHFPDGVNLDEKTRNIKLQTNDQKLAASYGRGTVFDMPENTKFIRSASFWQMDGQNNTWFDNGWNFFKEGWIPEGSCCWNNHMHNDAAVFSGDPVNSQELKGRGCQMIDLYIDRLVESGIRYAVWSILSFSQIKFDDAGDVLATLQLGENPEAGQLYEPSRAQFVFDIKGQNLTKYIAYLDLVERKIVYMDANLYGSTQSAGYNSGTLAQQMPAFVEYLDTLPAVFDLFEGVKKGTTPILHSDEGVVIESEKAYVFRKQNVNNAFEDVDVNSLLK